ncbi:DUF5086 family protein [Rhizobium etli]|uniref:DUF5086 family protein n=1 Tax=Rhizobium etli TaxID=29449 RepID=UPI001FD955E5|nr:DUF5086 family protein [Rhizobium etli]
MNRSRSRQKARTYFYKDIEFRIAYQNWRAQPRPQRVAGVCRTTILKCVGIAGKRLADENRGCKISGNAI